MSKNFNACFKENMSIDFFYTGLQIHKYDCYQ